jgi:hypothetical protein
MLTLPVCRNEGILSRRRIGRGVRQLSFEVACTFTICPRASRATESFSPANSSDTGERNTSWHASAVRKEGCLAVLSYCESSDLSFSVMWWRKRFKLASSRASSRTLTANHPERVLSSVLISHLVTTRYQVNPFLPCRDRGSRATTVRSPPTLTVGNEVFTVEAAAKGR